jgi:hypothetical protein
MIGVGQHRGYYPGWEVFKYRLVFGPAARRLRNSHGRAAGVEPRRVMMKRMKKKREGAMGILEQQLTKERIDVDFEMRNFSRIVILVVSKVGGARERGRSEWVGRTWA